MKKTGDELVKLTWENLWTNSFLSKVDRVPCKNSLGQIKSEQCRMLFYETALQTHESENTELIYQRSLFLQSLVLGQSITHFSGAFNPLYHKEGRDQYRNSKRIKTVKNHFFGWNMCFDDFLEIFSAYGMNIGAIRKAPRNSTLVQNLSSVQHRWDNAKNNYFRVGTSADDILALDDEESADDFDSEDDSPDNQWCANRSTSGNDGSQKNYFEKENMPSTASLDFLMRFLSIVEIDSNTVENGTGNRNLNACEQVVVATILLLMDAVVFDIAKTVGETIVILWKKYIDVINPMGRKELIEQKLREIFVHRQLYNLAPLLYSLPNDDVFDCIKVDIARRVLYLRCFPGMNEDESQKHVFAPNKLETPLNMTEINKYIEALPTLPSIGNRQDAKKNRVVDPKKAIRHIDTLDLIIMIGGIF